VTVKCLCGQEVSPMIHGDLRSFVVSCHACGRFYPKAPSRQGAISNVRKDTVKRNVQAHHPGDSTRTPAILKTSS
jgi:hypothetical protein